MVRLIDLIKNYPAQINAFSAVCALLISGLSIFFTIRTLRLQRIHNFKSLTPIANVLANDYENQLEVKIRNTGIGPLILKRFTASDGKHEKADIISWMPALPDRISWSDFSSYIEGHCIPPNQSTTFMTEECPLSKEV